MPDAINVEIDEGQRQLVLMALARLSVERPGFDTALNEIALKIDNRSTIGRGVLYDQFRELASDDCRDRGGQVRADGSCIACDAVAGEKCQGTHHG